MPGSTSAGSSSAHRSVAFQQRVRNRQPDGGVGLRRGLAGEHDAAADALDERVGDRRRRQQRLRVRVGRALVHLGGGPGLDDPAEVHHRDPVADVADDGQVVGDEQEPEVELGAQPLEQADDLGLDADVERRHRLVEHEQVGADGERPGDADALALPARELVRVATGGVGGSWTSSSSSATRAALVAGVDAVHLERLGEQLAARSSAGSATPAGPGTPSGTGAACRRSSSPREPQ